MQNSTGTLENNLMVSYKAKHISYDPTMSVLETDPIEMKTYAHTTSYS
jgi:hypothetical protein